MYKQYALGGVDGGSASPPGIASISGGAIGPMMVLPHPSAWPQGVRWEPVEVDIEAKDERRTILKYRAGFRVIVEVTWNLLTEAERALLIAKLNNNTCDGFRFYPHSGNPLVYYDCNMSGESNFDIYPLGAPIGYLGKLVMVSKRTLPFIIPWDEKKYCYTAGVDPSDYAAGDSVAYYTDSTLVGSYAPTDKCGFYWRDVKELETP